VPTIEGGRPVIRLGGSPGGLYGEEKKTDA